MGNALRFGLLCLVFVSACAIPERSSSRSPGSSFSRDLARVESRGSPDEVLRFLDGNGSRARGTEDKTLVELARGRALARQRHPHSASQAFQKAWSLVSPRRDVLAAQIQEAWGDAQLLIGEHRDAITHYKIALDCRGLGAAREERLMAGLSLAHELSHQPTEAQSWARRLGPRAEEALGRARSRLDLAPRVARSSGSRRPGTYDFSTPSLARRVLPEIHLRKEWRARPTRSNVNAMGRITRMTVHHSAMVAPSPSGVAAQLREIQGYHTQDNGWADIGYHILIDPQGGVWEGREWQRQGAHASGRNNVGNLGICLLGDFTTRPVPATQLASLNSVLDRLRSQYLLDEDEIFTHREFKSTQCPGAYLQASVNAYRKRVRETRSRQSARTSASVRRKSS